MLSSHLLQLHVDQHIPENLLDFIQTTSHTQNWLGWPVLLLKFQQPPNKTSTSGIIKRENTLLYLHTSTCFPVHRHFLAYTYGNSKNTVTDAVRNCSYISAFLIDPFRRSFFTQLLPKLIWTNLACHLMGLMRPLWPPSTGRSFPRLSVFSHQIYLAKTLQVHCAHSARSVTILQEN